MKTYQNYIFDLYGTLVDIHVNEQKAYLWKKMALWYQMKGAEYSPAQIKGTYHRILGMEEQRVGQGREIVIDRVFEGIFLNREIQVSREDIVDTALMFRCISIENLSLFEGVLDMLQELKQAGKKIYLLSNAQHLYAVPEMGALGIYHYFDGIMLSSDVGIKKPSMELYQKLIEEYHLNPEESLMTGKHDVEDCHGAKALGIDSCYIPSHMSPRMWKELPDNCWMLEEIKEVI